MIKNRNGSHVGFVVSFVLFVTFIVFMYAIISFRVDFGQEKANSLNYIKAEVTDRVSENLTGVSVSIGHNNPQSCVQLVDFFLKTGIGNRFIVRDDSGNILQSGKNGNDLFLERNGNFFLRVYGSEEFNASGGSLSGCQPLSEVSQGYTIGISRDSTEFFESKVLNLFENYTQNYEALKKDMKVSSGDEFGFGFTYNNGTEVRTPEENATINIYAERMAVQYIKRDAARESGFMDVMVW